MRRARAGLRAFPECAGARSVLAGAASFGPAQASQLNVRASENRPSRVETMSTRQLPIAVGPRASARGRGRVLVDFDGTVAPDDPTDRLLERFADPAWRDIEHAWQAGGISSRD